MYQQQLNETLVQCAHCGQIFRGASQAMTWWEAKVHVSFHQEKTYRYAEKTPDGVSVEHQQRTSPGDADGAVPL